MNKFDSAGHPYFFTLTLNFPLSGSVSPDASAPAIHLGAAGSRRSARAELRSLQVLNRVTDRFAHPSDLTVAALANRQPHAIAPTLAPFRSVAPPLRAPGAFDVHRAESLRQPRRSPRDPACPRHTLRRSFHAVTRMCQPAARSPSLVRSRSPSGVVVQTARQGRRTHAHPGQIQDRASALRIRSRRDETPACRAGCSAVVRGSLDPASIDANIVLLGVDFHAHRQDGFAVTLGTRPSAISFSAAPRSDASLERTF